MRDDHILVTCTNSFLKLSVHNINQVWTRETFTALVCWSLQVSFSVSTVIGFCSLNLNVLIIPKLPLIARMLKCCHSPCDDGIIIVSQRTTDKQHTKVIMLWKRQTTPTFIAFKWLKYNVKHEWQVTLQESQIRQFYNKRRLGKPEEMQTSTPAVVPYRNYPNCSLTDIMDIGTVWSAPRKIASHSKVDKDLT